MANHFSALKRVRQTEKRTARNRNVRSALRSTLRGLREAVSTGNKDQAQTSLRQAVAVLDRSVNKGVLHKNTAARYKSRLSARVNALGSK